MPAIDGKLSAVSDMYDRLKEANGAPKRTKRLTSVNAGLPKRGDPHGNGAAIVLRPCGGEDPASRKRHHWSHVIKAASYLHSTERKDTFIRKERGDKSMM